jgi:hypothetical protein
VGRASDVIEDGAKDIELARTGIDGFNARRDLERISGIDDENPVAMAEQRKFFGEAGAPRGLACRLR